tara:strand:- start:2540 stop:2722 length:183 start_codon:yes stop_codon:yes gene_type:complete
MTQVLTTPHRVNTVSNSIALLIIELLLRSVLTTGVSNEVLLGAVRGVFINIVPLKYYSVI